MHSTIDQAFSNLCRHRRESAILGSVASLLDWDEQTQMPPAAGPYRAEQMTLLSGMLHQRDTDPRIGEWLATLADSPLAAEPHSDESTIIRESRRDYDKKVKLPQSLVEALTRATVLGKQAWVTARADNNFALFRPFLEQIIQLKREEADALGWQQCRYDALLDNYEPGARTVEVGRTLSALREQLVPFVAAIAESGRRPDNSILVRSFPIASQQNFGSRIAKQIGFDFDRGRLDVTHHPFCTELGPNDCRITTRYNEQHFPGAFFGILHEAGHGLYEQGLRADQYGLPTGAYISLGIHESQSRLWENLVGRSRPFWEYCYPLAQDAFPTALHGVPRDDFFFAINEVRPSLIRVEADEATYNLHILIRFELEQALINDELSVADLPGAWHEKYQHYLGLKSPNDSDGVLQDIHWSAGLYGYFATYSLGNLYASQFFAQADKDLGGLDAMFRRGEFRPLRDWLREKIHVHGRRFSAAELVQRVTGQPLSHTALMAHLREKLGTLYEVC